MQDVYSDLLDHDMCIVVCLDVYGNLLDVYSNLLDS